MPRCTFCGRDIEKGTGKMLIHNSGKIDYLCSRKCDKNMNKLQRSPLKVRWTAHHRRDRGKSVSARGR